MSFIQTYFHTNKQRFKDEFVSLIKFIAILLTFTTFLYKPFNVPTGSMVPNLLIGDFLVTDKFSYGYTRFSLPFALPFIKGRVLKFGEPKQGDIIVFNNPKDVPTDLLGRAVSLDGVGKDYVKRLVGLPGDKIQMINGILHINDKPVKLERIEDFQLDSTNGHFKNAKVPHFKETLPNGVEHTIIKIAPFGMGPYDNTEPVIVPEGYMFAMGDNRDQSSDSRDTTRLGLVPQDQLIGKVIFVFFSTEAKWFQPIKWLTGIRFDRLVHWAN